MTTSLIGKYVIVRSSPSGCWAGTLTSLEGDTATLANARRLWRWWAAEGVSLSGVAAAGLHPEHLGDCLIAAAVETAAVFQVCEILVASTAARESVEAQPARGAK